MNATMFHGGEMKRESYSRGPVSGIFQGRPFKPAPTVRSSAAREMRRWHRVLRTRQILPGLAVQDFLRILRHAGNPCVAGLRKNSAIGTGEYLPSVASCRGIGQALWEKAMPPPRSSFWSEKPAAMHTLLTKRKFSNLRSGGCTRVRNSPPGKNTVLLKTTTPSPALARHPGEHPSCGCSRMLPNSGCSRPP